MTAYERLNKLIIFLQSAKEPISAKNLSVKIGLDESCEELIKQDIQNLLTYKTHRDATEPIFESHFEIKTLDDGETGYKLNLSNITTLPDLDKFKMLPANYFEYKLSLATTNLMKNTESFHRESDLLSDSNDLEEDEQFQRSFLFETKTTLDTYTIFDKTKQQHIRMITRAIKNKAPLLLDNKTIISPHVFGKDIITKELYYVYTENETGLVQIGSFEDGRKIDKLDSENYEYVKVSDEMSNKLKAIWSIAGKTLDEILQDKCYHIRLKIFDETGNILEKIQQEIGNRHNFSNNLDGPYEYLTENNKNAAYYYYDDDIIGIDAFRKFVLKYGRSIIVLEPKELAYDIYKKLVAEH